MGFYDGEIDVEGNVTWGFPETMFEANFDPNQPRNSLGQWVKKDGSPSGEDSKLFPIVNQETTEPTMDLDIDELSALAQAIRLQD